jgi:hypothetical protein
MAWISVPGLEGKVYKPERCRPEQRKHPCRDCFECQHCGEDRCSVCRAENNELPDGRSMGNCLSSP